MSPEAQRTAIAEFCGWTPVDDGLTGRKPGRTDAEYLQIGNDELPDYLNDLNAMHEAEELLSIEQKENFVAFLANATQMKRTKATINSDYFTVAHATAAQRAEALLRTIGK